MTGTETVFNLLKFIQSKQDDIISFITGDIVSMIIVLQFDFFHSVLKITGVLILGAVGGFGGLLGKKLFVLIDDFIKKVYKHLTRKRGI